MFNDLRRDFAMLITVIDNTTDFRKKYPLNTSEGLQRGIAAAKRMCIKEVQPQDMGFYSELLTAEHRSELFEVVHSLQTILAPTPLYELLSDLVNLHGGAKGIPLFLRTDDELAVENAIPG